MNDVLGRELHSPPTLEKQHYQHARLVKEIHTPPPSGDNYIMVMYMHCSWYNDSKIDVTVTADDSDDSVSSHCLSLV